MLLEIAKVLTFGAGQYGDNNWQDVDGSRGRYAGASMRHYIDWQLGNKIDKESGCHVLAHQICSIMFLLHEELKP